MKTVIELARETGFTWGEIAWHDEMFERFAELVREEANARANASWTLMCEKMVAIEREACAKLMDEMAAQDKRSNYYKVAGNAIRARGIK